MISLATKRIRPASMSTTTMSTTTMKSTI